jgi:hypothetical protein
MFEVWQSAVFIALPICRHLFSDTASRVDIVALFLACVYQKCYFLTYTLTQLPCTISFVSRQLHKYLLSVNVDEMEVCREKSKGTSRTWAFVALIGPSPSFIPFSRSRKA